MRVAWRSTVALFLAASAMLPSVACASDRPFWTEKSSYREGDQIFFVGVATKKESVEAGRQAAMTNARDELKGFLQSKSTDGITFNTQMTWEERNKNGTYDVYRLMWVSVDEISAFRQRLPADDGAKVEEKLFKLPNMTELSTAYVRFKYPKGWNCNLMAGIWVCGSKLGLRFGAAAEQWKLADVQKRLVTELTSANEVYLMSIATIATEWDTLANYETYLAQRREIKSGDSTLLSDVSYTRRRSINGKTWIDSLHKNAEVPGYWVRYLAATHDFKQDNGHTVELAMLITIMVPDERYAEFAAALDEIVTSLKLNSFLPSSSLNVSRSVASNETTPSKKKKGASKFEPTDFEPACGLTISSEPTGANVLIDGRETGTTPTKILAPCGKSVVITLTADGYATDRSNVVLKQVAGQFRRALKKSTAEN